MSTAILVDGGYFIKRYRSLINPKHSPKKVARTLHAFCFKHLSHHNKETQSLYRIFFYDCPPLLKKGHQPISKKAIDYAKTPEALFRLTLHEELRQLRKVALRFGRMSENGSWMLKADKVKKLIQGKLPIENLTDNDFQYDMRQKGVDMKIGLDIASLTYKKLVDQIILISGDSDFVPAAKLARREGIDFILDPMWGNINPDLHEHIDGLKTTCPSRQKTTLKATVMI